MTLDEETVDLESPTGSMRAHVYRPATTEGRYPGIVLYSEIYQETAPIRRSALRLAGHGYVVLVPEVFHEQLPAGTILGYDKVGTDEGNRLKYDTLLTSFDTDANTAVSWLSTHGRCTGRVGAIGFCLGGHLAFRAALISQTLATACFYATDLHTDTLGRGKSSDSLQRMKEIRGELLMVWGRQDPHVPDEGRAIIQAKVRESGVRFAWHEFNAVHAFMRDEGPRYDPALASLGYQLALEMFERVLKIG